MKRKRQIVDCEMTKTPGYRFTDMKASALLTLSPIIVVLAILSACNNPRREISLSAEVPEIDRTREAKILTAFFGLDNGLPQRARALYKNAPGQDGMPLVFSLEVDPSTLDATDFEVTVVQGTDTLITTPFQLADVSDNDNNIDLCLKETGIPIKLTVKENTAIDPRGDKNPRTEIEVVSRW